MGQSHMNSDAVPKSYEVQFKTNTVFQNFTFPTDL